MPRQQTLALYLVEKVGWRAAGQVVGLLVAWAGWMETHGGEVPNIRQLMGDTTRSRASYYRDLAHFEKAFPREESPERIARVLLSKAKAGKNVGAVAFSVPLGAVA